ncbi:hypothetical protein KC363_g5390 [Hortaea werneckii]|uniref:F-box domain-containing protein n=1 Tax=Hortaea werneckii TaxID=91943 RepID=A0A3M7FEF9_HORWE|nr:hypothetical protein KC361_g3351 [Hortaea werneckii]KAI7090159.1 hypothetical protein KC356_g1814 [Hortaea werneckii]KAI7188551.1 hypothetical protein KC363_g5390 [Hortaea werneckii]KAI7514522.1 hypothetical protein KC347_g555 [Hortaea werneckii]RMY87209.1 hypothetical protein D0861_05513 [Hortaea werneckii]
MATTPDPNETSKEPKSSVPQNTFLGLPQELRDEISAYLVLKPRNTVITMLSNHDCHRSEVSAAQPALARVNRQLRQEILPQFYGSNHFLAEVSDAEDLATAKRWLDAIGDENAGSLCKLVLCGWTRVPFGHMISRRWVKVGMDLQRGRLELEPTGQTGDEPPHPYVSKSIEGLRRSFERLAGANHGAGTQRCRFTVAALKHLLDGFHGLCAAY